MKGDNVDQDVLKDVLVGIIDATQIDSDTLELALEALSNIRSMATQGLSIISEKIPV